MQRVAVRFGCRDGDGHFRQRLEKRIFVASCVQTLERGVDTAAHRLALGSCRSDRAVPLFVGLCACMLLMCVR